MIDPDGLLKHAEQLADTRGGRPTDADLRRGISAAYYAVFHDLTGHAATHLVGSCTQEIQNEIRRSWSHGEISQLAEYVVNRAIVLNHSPDAELAGQLEELGPLLDVVATDAALVDCLQLFNDMQELRHSDDYDHGVEFATWELAQACDSARLARMNPARCKLRSTRSAVYASHGSARRFSAALIGRSRHGAGDSTR